MLVLEKKVCGWIKQNIDLIFLWGITLLALAIRISGSYIISPDMKDALLPWFNAMKQSQLHYPIGDYGLLYQSYIYIMTLTSLSAVWQYKVLSIFFDFALAFISADFCCKLLGKDKFSSHYLLIYAAVLFLPTVFIDSGFWGQCDSIYSFFVVWSLYLLYTDKIKCSYAVLGIAFAFKLQTIFIVPFYLYYYFQKQTFSIFNFLITLIVFWLSGFLGYIKGQSIWSLFIIYANQASSYSQKLYYNIHSFGAIFKNDPSYITAATIITLAILTLGLYAIAKRLISLENKQNFMMVATWSVWVCVLFLPKMHERYTYLLDILLLLLSMTNKKFFLLFFISEALSLVTYANCFGIGEGNERRYLSLLYTGMFIWYTFIVAQENSEDKSIENKEKNNFLKRG